MRIENLNQFPSISGKNDGIYSASFIYPSQLSYIKSGSQGYNFSSRIEDNVEVSIFDSATQDLIAWFPLYGKMTSTQTIESSYINLEGKLTDNSYVVGVSDFFTVNPVAAQVVFDPASDIETAHLNADSPYTISYLPISNRVGNYHNPITVKEISPSRTEIKLNYSQKADPNTIAEFNNYITNKFTTEVTSQGIIEKTEFYRIDELYFGTKDQNENVIKLLKNVYSLKRDVDVIQFFEYIHKGSGTFSIFYQFKNWLFVYYNTGISEQELISDYNKMANFLIDKFLSEKGNSDSQTYVAIREYVKTFMNTIYITSIKTTFSEYNRLRLEPLRSALNFGGNHLYNILNLKGSGKDIVVKLQTPLDEEIEVGESCYISRLVCEPHFVEYSPYFIEETELVELRPTDYSTFRFNDLQTGVNEELSFSQQNKIRDQVNKLQLENVNVDYKDFKNFVQFSSAQQRVNVFEIKKNKIEQLEDTNSQLLPTTDSYYIQEVSGNLNTISKIKNSFDGYESFLFNNNDWYVKHSEEYDGESSASRYDRENPNNLVNNIPEYIVNDIENNDFVKFINVIGHHFDSIYVSINQFNESKYSTDVGSALLFEEAVNKLLSAMGWDSSYSSRDVFLELFGEDRYGNLVESKSGNERKKIIWRRFIHALPYIVKTKGTAECLRILFSVYGIPKSLYKVREFNSIPNTSSERENVFSFDNNYYALHYSGSVEYIRTQWQSDIQSVEFKFAFDTELLHPNGSIFRMLSLGDNWVIGVLRDGNDPILGKMFFTLVDSTNPTNYKTLVTDSAPLFDGTIYSVLLRKNDIIIDSELFEPFQVSSSLVPRKFDLVVQKSEGTAISIQASSSYVFNYEYGVSFEGSGSDYVYIGNYDQVVTSSLTPDADAFFGIIDEVKYYRIPLTIDRFDSHTKYIDAFDISDPLQMESSLALYLSFEKPQDLYIGSTTESLSSGYVRLRNNAFSSSLQDVRAYNFPKIEENEPLDFSGDFCVEYPESLYFVSASFPWHFKSFSTREYITVPNFGSSTLNNEKIYFYSGSRSEILFTDFSVNYGDVELGSSSPTIGIFFSPTDQLNLEILQFLGKIDIGDYIGTPYDLYERTYHDFNAFRRHFFKYFNGINFNEYIKILKHYVDSSIFKNIERTIPARAKLKTGILIEPSILERNKIHYHPPQISSHAYEASIRPNTLEYGELLSNLEDTIDLDIRYTGTVTSNDYVNTNNKIKSSTPVNPINEDYVKDTPKPVVANGGVVIDNNERYYAQVYKTVKRIYKFTNNSSSYAEKVVEKLNLTPLLGSTVAQAIADSDDKFGAGNYRTLTGYTAIRRPRYRRRIGSLSEQTHETTMAEPDETAVVVPQISNPLPSTPEVAVIVPKPAPTSDLIVSMETVVSPLNSFSTSRTISRERVFTQATQSMLPITYADTSDPQVYDDAEVTAVESSIYIPTVKQYGPTTVTQSINVESDPVREFTPIVYTRPPVRLGQATVVIRPSESDVATPESTAAVVESDPIQSQPLVETEKNIYVPQTPVRMSTEAVTETTTVIMSDTPVVTVTDESVVVENQNDRIYYQPTRRWGSRTTTVVTGTTTNGSSPFGTTITDPTSIQIVGNDTVNELIV